MDRFGCCRPQVNATYLGMGWIGLQVSLLRDFRDCHARLLVERIDPIYSKRYLRKAMKYDFFCGCRALVWALERFLFRAGFGEISRVLRIWVHNSFSMGTKIVTHAESMQGFMEASRRVCTTRRHWTADSANFCHRSNSTVRFFWSMYFYLIFLKRSSMSIV